MKTKISGAKKRSRSHHASSKVQSNRGLRKIEMRKGSVSTPEAKKNHDASQSRPRKIETEHRAKQKLNGAKTNGSAVKKIRAADMVRAANEKPSVLRQESKRTLGRAESNGEAAASEQSMTATAVNEKTEQFDLGLNRTWLDWTYATMPAVLMTTNDLMRRKSPMDLMAIGSRLALSSWLDVWLQVLEGQRNRRKKASAD